ncbi:MAG: type II CRISPR-associated endonuclease Cas1 [Rickettsiales bacterium]|jgi:CRISPR-associated protein Cas1|nr:type II CRISPR-associated endonuclease Cas1 [Rickettsiales bacterium]
MGWRILQLTKPCKLSVKNKQLLYESDDNKTTFPIEDLSVVILETGFAQLTGSLLSELAANGVVLFACDQTHQPAGAFFPFHEHSRYAEIAHLQIAATEPLKKRLWQSIVQQKIMNQASLLKLLGKNNSSELQEIAKRVQSGDTDNREGYAAALYWKSLFENFTRNDDASIINKSLNYGYAILRGCVARNIVGTGLVPCFGIHHDNKLNQFNLVDDLIEPFRPFLDFIVASTDFEGRTELTPQLKNKLVSILIHNCNMGSEEISILKACEMSAESLAKAVREKDSSLLKLPTLEKRPTIQANEE